MRSAWALLVAVLVAGCSDAPPEVEEPDAVDAEPSEPAFVEQVVRIGQETVWNGRTKEGAFVCSDQDGTGSCSAGQQVLPDGEHTLTFLYTGTFSEVSVDMTWSPADASQTGLVLTVYGGGSLLGSVRGGPDLNLTLAPTLPPDGNLTLIVWPEGKTSTQPSVFVDATRQSFTATVNVVTTSLERVAAEPAQ